MTWTERGGAVVTAPERPGQGTRFIDGSARYELRGEAKLDFRPEGLRATIDFPLLRPENAAAAAGASEESSDVAG